jgi:hypothetical protein
VNWFDVWYIANDWLFNEPVNLPYDGNVAPDNSASKLLLWYKFDETSGINVADSSTNGWNGTVNNYSTLRNGFMRAYVGYDNTGKCFNFEPGLRSWIEVPPGVLAAQATAAQTFSFWIDMNTSVHMADGYPSVFMMFSANHYDDSAGTGDTNDTQIIETQFPVEWPPRVSGYGPQLRWVDQRAAGVIVSSNQGFSTKPWDNFSAFSGRWNHYALVFNTATTSMRVYLNGKCVAFRTDTTLGVWSDPCSIRIGTRCNKLNNPSHGFWQGKLDDLRIYNYALTDNQVQYLATSGKGTRAMSFIEPDNMETTTQTVDGVTVQIINFQDYAKWATNWTNQQMWP